MSNTKITGRDAQSGCSISVTVENGIIARIAESKTEYALKPEVHRNPVDSSPRGAAESRVRIQALKT